MLGNASVSPTLPVTDLERAKKFYQDTLGLKLVEEQAGHVTYECGNGTSLLIYQRSSPPKADNTAAGFMVDDLAAVMDDLRGRGVVFEEYDFPGLKTENGVAAIGSYKSAWFKDPDGNILALNHRI